MSGTVARSLGALGDALGGTANANFDANTLFIDSVNNRVGIGTTAPSTRFEVSGAGFNGGQGIFRSTNSGVGVSVIGVNGAGINDSAFITFEDGTAARNCFIGLTGDAATGGAGSLRFATGNNTERMRIDAAGNVRIGTANTLGNSRLDVDTGITARTAAASGVSPFLQLLNGNAGTDQKTWRVGATSGGAFTVESVNDAYSSATQRLFIAANGNIGFGTSTPEFPITVNRGGGAALALIGGGDLLFRNDTGTGSVQVYCDTNSEFKVAGSIAMGDPGSGASYISHGAWRGNLDRAWDNYPSITIYNTTDRGPQGEFRIHGAGGANGGDFSIVTRSDGGYVSGSDSRRKTNIQTITSPLDKVLAITGKEYHVVNKDGEIEDSLSHSGKKIGFIGQEIIDVLPEVVKFYPDADTPTESGWASAYSIDYGSVTALLVEAIKEQQTLIQSLMTRIDALENK